MTREKPYSFWPSEAEKYGIEKAVILYNLRHWLTMNKAAGKKMHFHDGFWWTYNAASAFEQVMPFFSRRSISRWMKELESQGVIKSGVYNSAAYDRTKWYTIPSEFSNDTNGQNGQSIGQDGQPNGQNGQPIPVVNPVENPDVNQSNVPAKPKPSKYKYEFGDLTFAEQMYSRILALNPNQKKPNLDSWANTIRLCREQDNRDLESLWAVFDWANKDNFWSSNILSPEKLRKQFDTLIVKIKQPQQQSSDFGQQSVSNWAEGLEKEFHGVNK